MILLYYRIYYELIIIIYIDPGKCRKALKNHGKKKKNLNVWSNLWKLLYSTFFYFWMHLQFDEDHALKKDLLCKSFTTFVFDIQNVKYGTPNLIKNTMTLSL